MIRALPHRFILCLLALGLLMPAVAGAAVPDYRVTDEGFRIDGTQSPAENRAEGDAPRDLTGHNGRIVSVAFSPDGRILASGSADKSIKLWDVASGELLHTLEGHDWPVVSVDFSPDGRSVVSGGVYDIMLWDVASGDMLNNLRELESRVEPTGPVAFSPNGRTVAAGGNDNTVKLWDAGSSVQLRILSGHADKVWPVVFSSDGGMLASSGNDKDIRLWNPVSGELLNSWPAHRESVNALAFSPDGNLLASSSVGLETINLWDVQTGTLRQTLDGHDLGYVWSLDFSPDGRILATASRDETIKLWDTGNGRLLNTLEGHDDDVLSVSLSPDGRTLASGSMDNTVKLWQIRPNEPEMLQSAIESELARQQSEHDLEQVPEPSLPPEQILEKSPFDTVDEFDERVEKSWEVWQQHVEEIEENYRQQVAARNRRVEEYQSQIDEYRRQALPRAFAEIYGQPLLTPIRDDGEIRYNADTSTLYAELEFSQMQPGRFRHEVAFKFDDNDTGERVSAALEAGELPARADFIVTDDQFTLHEVSIRIDGQRYTASPEQTDFRSEAISVAIGGGHRIDLEPQAPVIGSRVFQAELARAQSAPTDDLPGRLARSDEAQIDPSKWLFVIGIGEYRDADNILYSRRSADMFAKVAAKTLGIAPGQQRVLLDGDATAAAIEYQLQEMLTLVGKGESIYFYYSGHGIPVPQQDDDPYILPADLPPDYAGSNLAHRVQSIYQQLSESQAGKVFIFMDSCFTGGTDGRGVLGGEVASSRLRPKRFEVRDNGKLAVLTAGTDDQFSWAFEERRHRLFSYYLMRAMLDGIRDMDTLENRVSADVYQESRGRGRLRQQNPQFQGNRDLSM